ncbi:MAG: hypothetical protein KatS3mg031_0311 [Chitinophagales bacterium]|nr:MAG: hypothetical protein KatS3mg031_0311 [Chitinophagales bacterium]
MVTGIQIHFLLKAILRTLLFILLLHILTSAGLKAQSLPAEAVSEAVALMTSEKSVQGNTSSIADNAEPGECYYAKSVVEEGKVMKAMKREEIITFTPPGMESLYTDGHYMVFDGYLSNYNGTIVLFARVTFFSNEATQTYGSLFKNHELLLKTDDGQIATLRCGQSESGSLNATYDKTTYLTYYEIDDSAYKILLERPVVAARMFWSKGYEDYTVSNPGFFQRQLSCVR